MDEPTSAPKTSSSRRVALDLARQPQLTERMLERPGSPAIRVFELPALTGSWARASEGLAHPVTGKIRPITFDHAVAAGHDDVVLVHLQHRLVQQSLRLLRAEIWASDETSARLNRITARLVPDHILDEPAVVAYGRLVITGADGHRLHEEVVQAGGRIRDGRFARFGVGELENALAAASLEPPTTRVYETLASKWGQYSEPLLVSLDVRARDRAESLKKTWRSAGASVDAIAGSPGPSPRDRSELKSRSEQLPSLPSRSATS
jgi:hypothetical protein